MIAIFTSYDAAKSFRLPGAEGNPGNNIWAKEQHAAYFFDTDKHEDYLIVTPFGFSTPQEYSTRLDLGPALATCKLELGGRCLLAAAEPEYPTDVLNAHISGKVALSGAITPDGEIKNVEVASIEPSSDDTSRQMVAKAAIQNLRSWKMDVAPREDSVRITYSFEIKGSPMADSAHVIFDLPDKIVVFGKPLK